MAKRLLYRPLWLAAAISGVVLVAGVALMVRTSSRSLARLTPLHNHMANLNRIQKTGLDLEEELGRLAETEGSIPPQRIEQLLGDAGATNSSATTPRVAGRSSSPRRSPRRGTHCCNER